MVTQIKVTGMVLTSMAIGDYDKRLVILTKERGKITAFAKGARKQNSALLACSQPFSFGEFIVYEGRSSYSIISVNISNYFVELREELDSVSYGLYFCEFADYLARENSNEINLLKLLYQSLKALVKKTIPYELIRYIYELKILTLNGEAPQTFECVRCKNTQDNYLFSSHGGGLLCNKCAVDYKDIIQVSNGAIYTMQYIITSPIEKLYTFKLTEAVLNELRLCLKQYVKTYVDKSFKSLDMLRI